jgi:NAD(P)-dependent dehydrogenase (short-subunit alcohol dehydrogenase family)
MAKTTKPKGATAEQPSIMNELEDKTAVVVGASSGIGRATLVALGLRGMKVYGVARDRERLERITREAAGDVTAMPGDATEPEVAARIVRDLHPDLVVVALGARPKLAPVDEHTWDSFSSPWNTDVKAAFHLCQEAVRLPLRPGSVVIVVSSGAAIGGSPLSGGYAGAKRMQWFLAGYMQGLSKRRGLGIRFAAVVPKQLVVGTAIGDEASTAYGDLAGIGQAKFMERFGVQLMPEGVADAIVKIALDEHAEASSFAVTGAGIELLQ